MKNFIPMLIAACFAAISLKAQTGTNSSHSASNTISSAKDNTPVNESIITQATEKRVNIYVMSNAKKIDILGFSVKVRAAIRSIFSSKRLHVIVTGSSKFAADKIDKIIKKSGHKKIGNIWFDSHGHYAYGYSSFGIGKDEFSYQNIRDTSATKNLQRIALHCDEYSHIGIGSCYGGASFIFPGTSKLPKQSMKGDSLMIGVGKIFSSSSIYACESWVMAKPGIFSNNFAFAGFPLNKRFKDSAFLPVWLSLGEWHRYQQTAGYIENVNTISLNKYGEICARIKDYKDLGKAQKSIAKKTEKLQPGLYKKFNK